MATIIGAMATGKPSVPPRPLGPGDIVVGFCDELGEWVAAQITDLDPEWKTAGRIPRQNFIVGLTVSEN